LGGFLIAILIGWFASRVFDEDLAGCNSSFQGRRYLKFMLRWVSPPVIAFGLIVSLIDLL
jgi:NSS family neurotransmitter:Na+ symporter